MSTKQYRICGAVATILSMVGIHGCAGPESRKVQADATPPVAVDVLQLQPEDVPIYSEFAAQTYARNSVDVRGRVTGYVEKWLFEPGAEVKAGQELYRLDLSPYQASVDQAKGTLRESEADLEFARKQVSLLQAEAGLATAEANLIKARQDYERIKPLAEGRALPKQDLDAATATLAASEASLRANRANVEQAKLSTRTNIEAGEGKVQALQGALRTADLNLQYAVIRAPIGGRIGDTTVAVGGLVTPNSVQPLTTIVPLDPIWVRFKVTEAEYLSWMKNGQQDFIKSLPLLLVLADGVEFPAKGHIETMLNQLDPKIGTLEIQASFPNPKHVLLPGQFGRVRVQVAERKNAIVIPQRAVQQLQNISSVYTLNSQDRVQAQTVTTGDRVGGTWIINQGLKPGDRVIVEGRLRVKPGMLVKPLPWKKGS